MKTTFTLTAGAVLLLAACHSTKTDTWQKVVSAPHATSDVKDRSRAYAAELHATLLHAGIAHKVVTFQFRYSSKYTISGTAERTAIIYRDPAETKHPYWIMDDHLTSPVWLPEGSVERQVDFYLRRPATIVSVTDFPATDDKDVKPLEKSTPRKKAVSRIQPVAPAKPAAPPQPKAEPQPAKISKPEKPHAEPKTTITPVEEKKPAAAIKAEPAPNPSTEKKAPLINKADETPQAIIVPEPAAPKLRARPGLISSPTSSDTRKPNFFESLFARIFDRA